MADQGGRQLGQILFEIAREQCRAAILEALEEFVKVAERKCMEAARDGQMEALVANPFLETDDAYVTGIVLECLRERFEFRGVRVHAPEKSFRFGWALIDRSGHLVPEYIPDLVKREDPTQEVLEESLVRMAQHGLVGAMQLIKAKGAVGFNHALVEAGKANQPAALRLLKEWGATCFGLARLAAEANGAVSASILLAEWEDETLDPLKPHMKKGETCCTP
jgi:hypothetical protein